MQGESNTPNQEGHVSRRPYRSHLFPACLACKKRKSRCRTTNLSSVCTMCNAHGTSCTFPQADGISSPSERPISSPRKLIPKKRNTQNRPLRGPPGSNASPYTRHMAIPDSPLPHNETNTQCPLPNLLGIVAEAGDNSSHVVSPAVAKDNDILESYLSTIPDTRRPCIIRANTDSNRLMRPVLFNTVPRRPLGLFSNQSLPATKCEIIEKYLEPNLDEVVDLFFRYANICFPMFDEGSFRNVYGIHREKISPALLCNLYANSLIYWENSSELSSSRLPDVRYIWNQANEALHSELFLSPGISTVMAIILNVCGRPSTSIFGNGGMVGTAVALSNALGLNRDPSKWNISPVEKRFRIRIWWLVVVNDRWCSLAYGTPLQIHRAQYDVPFPTVDDLRSNCTSQSHIAAAEVFVAFTSLTEVMSEYLEHVYKVSVHVPYPPERSAIELEGLLTDWEESLTGDIRRMVLHGTDFDAPGAANFRLAYLAVKLLLRRLQLDVDKNNSGIIDDTDSHYYKQAQRAAEKIVHLVQELDESHLRGFWLPVNSFSLTSATTFLLRSGLRKGGLNNHMFLDIAKDMIDRLRSHSESFCWDLADNCLASCSDLVDKISSTSTQDVFFDSTVSNFFQEHLDFNQSFLNDFMVDFPEITPTVGL